MIKKIYFKCVDDIKKSLEKNYVVHAIPEVDIDLDAFYLNAIDYIGLPFNSQEDFFTKNKTGQLWSDIKYIKEKSDSFSYSNTRQPFHTDGAYESKAPDISFFYCIKKADFGGATIFVDTNVLINCLSFYDKNLLQKIKNTPIRHYKGNDQKILPILNDKNWNWNYFRADKIQIVEDFNYFLEEVIYKSGLYEAVCLNEKEALFFWDTKVLHGRNAFLGDRHLKKAGIYV